jgi:sarcosine oxidase subunit gamma
LLANAGVVVWQIDDKPTFRLLVRASFARHVKQWLTDASAEDEPLP